MGWKSVIKLTFSAPRDVWLRALIANDIAAPFGNDRWVFQKCSLPGTESRTREILDVEARSASSNMFRTLLDIKIVCRSLLSISLFSGFRGTQDRPFEARECSVDLFLSLRRFRGERRGKGGEAIFDAEGDWNFEGSSFPTGHQPDFVFSENNAVWPISTAYHSCAQLFCENVFEKGELTKLMHFIDVW